MSDRQLHDAILVWQLRRKLGWTIDRLHTETGGRHLHQLDHGELRDLIRRMRAAAPARDWNRSGFA